MWSCDQSLVTLAFQWENFNFIRIWPEKLLFFWGVLLVQIQWFGIGTRYKLEILHQSGKRNKTKGERILGVNSNVCRNYREKTGRGGGFFPSSILNRVNPNLVSRVGFLGVLFEVWEGKINKKLKAWYVSKHTYVVSENMPVSTKILLILLMSAFFFGKVSTFTQSSGVRAVLEIF